MNIIQLILFGQIFFRPGELIKPKISTYFSVIIYVIWYYYHTTTNSNNYFLQYYRATMNYYKNFRSYYIQIDFNGSVSFSTFATLYSYCDFDLQWYPYDQQTCKLEFASGSYDEKMVIFEI